MVRQCESGIHTVFGLMEAKRTAAGVSRRYHTWISDVLEKGSTLAIAMLRDLIPTLPATVRKLTLWSDCGPHFRSCQFAFWALVDLREAVASELKLQG